ncbi:MAG: M56 family metallopeptidase [Geminocystis sp.]|nr:M56 family metallopeptidase [Geminocystis sp.]HIK36905.1 M48 family metalloprotease [Geminocystis sp. M7585_C2015_104]MCS7148549.1 M56 family metallopeptidase [Geminocystis sp.]MCX8079505.1 M56 family metallopeptidase [Geminocystis sp.]MDW8114878.1 M56 family metallopeptidase [Geminocystis sp.]
MHLLLIVSSIFVAVGIRIFFPIPSPTENGKLCWGKLLFHFAFPPLLLLMTALVVVVMGYQGKMWGIKAGKFSYFLSLAFLIYAVFVILKNLYQQWQIQSLLTNFPGIVIEDNPCKLLDTPFPYAAVVGLWNPQLVVSEGLIKLLSPPHLKSVIAHELGHLYYRDTFLFFWLSCLKTIGFSLPKSEQIWENLALMRELRADLFACQKVDHLLVAESLIIINSYLLNNRGEKLLFECPLYSSRLGERVENLLENREGKLVENYRETFWLILAFIPWIFLPFHSVG